MKNVYLRKRLTLVLLCMALQLPMIAGAQTVSVITIGDTTSIQSNYNPGLPYVRTSSSYTQQIVLGSELNGAAMITGIDLYTNSGDSYGRAGCTIYMANTYDPGSYQSTQSMVQYGALFKLVAVNNLACTTGWNHYNFDTAFYYNGLGNLLIAVDCAAPSSIHQGANFSYCYTTSAQMYSRYVQSRLSSVSSYTTPNRTDKRNVMRLHTQPVPAPAATCPAPTLWVDSLGSTAVRVKWSPGYQDTSWTVECIADGESTWRTSGLVWGDTTYTMTGLSPNTHYTFRITAFCTDTVTTVLRHVLTNCTPAALPYTEGFEGLTALPNCWSTTLGFQNHAPELNSSNSHSHNSTYSLHLYGGNAVLPAMDAPPDSLELSFWVKNGSANASVDMYVGMVTDPLDFSTFVPFDTVAVSHYITWNPVVVRFDHYTGASGRIAFKSNVWMTFYQYIDDIEVHRVVPCQTITDVTIDHVTDTAAMVHWVDTIGAVYYDVAYGPVGCLPDSAQIITDVRADSLLLTGLMPYTQYDVYVRSECGSFYTNWSPVQTFRTFCSPIVALPYTDDFEAYSSSSYTFPAGLPCWRGRGEDYYTYVTTAVGGHSGIRTLCWNWRYNTAVPNQHAILPVFNTAVHPINTLQFSFWARNQNQYSGYEPARFLVGVMTDPEVDSTFTLVDTVFINSDVWRRYDVSLGSYTGTGSYITLKSCPGVGVRSSWMAYIDDILVDTVLPCASVSGMYVKGLTSTSVTVGWDSPYGDSVIISSPGAGWQTFIDTVDTATPVADTAVVTTPAYTFTGLTTEVPYYVWVRAICPKGDTSDWEGPMQVVPGEWNMRAGHNDTMVMCGVSLYDDGGASGAFVSQTSSLVILPDIPGHLVSISGQCDIGGGSTFTIYDGIGTTGSVLWTKSINNSMATYFGPIISSAGPLTIVFRGNAYGGPYDGFDMQVSCVPDTCIIRHLRLDPSVPATDSVLALTWECNGASHYEVEYGPVGFASGMGTLDTTSSNSYMITGLASFDRREVHVHSICGEGDTGSWVKDIFATQPCGDAVYRTNYDSTMYSSSHNALPIGINARPYSYVQTLVDSAHLAGLEGGITALAFHPNSNVEGDHLNNITVYLANVADTDFSAGPILPDAGHRFVKVIDSANFCHTATTDWQTISFDRPFMWDGHKNLLVAVLREDAGSGVPVGYSGHYRYSDYVNNIWRGYTIVSDNAIDIDSARTYSYGWTASWLVGDMRLYTNTCNLPLCAKPSVDTVTGDYENVTVAWSGTSDEYQVAIDQYWPATSYPVSEPVSVSGNQYTFTGLQPNTRYAISLRQNCMADSLGYSDWVTLCFSTLGCPDVTEFDTAEVGSTMVVLTWYAEPMAYEYLLEYGPAGFELGTGIEQTVVSNNVTVTGLTPATAYDFYLRTVCDSGWYSDQYASLQNVVTRQGVGINEVDGRFRFSLLPNPAKGMTTVQIVGQSSQLSGMLHVAVSDLTGRDVLVRDIECGGECQVSMDIEGLSAGAYFVRVSNGQASAVRKLIVK